jgi:hypothetical protein
MSTSLIEECPCPVGSAMSDYDPQTSRAINVSNATAFGVEIPARADEVIELGAERMTPVPANGLQEGMLLRHRAFPDLLSGTS